MRAVYVIFDSLNQRFLPGGSHDWVKAPNFERLERHTVRFSHCYIGSMACMPARREMHTGRYNFLHSPWGPLEPFDESFVQVLGDGGVHTHLATDHPHYFADGGSTYHTRFTTWEFERGQEGDPWKGVVDSTALVPTLSRVMEANQPARMWDQEFVNRSYLRTIDDYPHMKTFRSGLEFIQTNQAADGWFLQIETFDAHEPFHTPSAFRDLYPRPVGEEVANWPSYGRSTVPVELEAHWRYSYGAAISMIDDALGMLLDVFDEHSMWDNTMLIVGTDHGFLLGEHGWWGKNLPPWFNEIANIPLYIWDPRVGRRGVKRDSLVQTIDIGPTLLGAFGMGGLTHAQGFDLADTVTTDRQIRSEGLFGAFGGHINYTDGTVVYMRAPASFDEALFRYTLLPLNIRSPVPPSELADATLEGPRVFTQGAPLLRFRSRPWGGLTDATTMLFDLGEDPDQRTPFRDSGLERRLDGQISNLLEQADAPAEVYDRFDL